MLRLLLALTLAIVVAQARDAAAVARLLEFVDEVPAPQLYSPVASTVSADGAHAYVAAGGNISIFSRDPGTGALTFVALAPNEGTGIVGNTFVWLALSPDGAHLYALGRYALVVFGRDAGTGTLTWIQTKRSGVDGVAYLYNATDMVVSPDGAHVYVVTPYYDALLRFTRNALTGELTFDEAMLDGAPDGLNGASALAVAGDGAYVYVASYYDSGVAIFSRDGGTGALTLVASESVSYATNIAISPDDAHLYVASSYLLSVYSRDAGTGALTFEQVHADGAGGITAMGGISGITITPDGAHAYIPANYDDALVVFSRDAGTGHLTLVAQIQNGGGLIGLNNPNSVTASPDGAQLYLAAGYQYSSASSALSTFSRNAGTGAITQLQYLTPSGSTSSIALSPEGAHLYAARGDKLSTYARDAGTGALSHASDATDGFGGIDGLGSVRVVAVSPDGAHVYAISTEDALSAFSRNGTTGVLTQIEVERDGVGGVDGLDGAQDLVISSDGAYLYVAADADDAVTVFARDAGTGAVTQTAGGADLSNARDLTLSPDGAHLYVATSNGVSTFGRDAGTGALTLAGTLPVPDGASSTSVSADGAFVYLLLSYGARDLFQVFSRDGTTGALTLVGATNENEAGLSVGSGKLHLSADGTAAYLGGAIFARNPTNGLLGFMARPNVFVTGSYAFGPNGEVYTSSFGSVQRFAPGYAPCEDAPLPVCHAVGGGTLRLGYRAPNIAWSWIAAAAVMPADFGNPDLTDHYALCVYDESGPTPMLILRVMAPAGQQCATARDCWTPSSSGFSYRDRYRTPEGISSLTLKAGAANVARVRVVSGKSHLVFPGLPLPIPIRVQLQSSAGACFEATYSDPSTNSSQGFLARPD